MGQFKPNLAQSILGWRGFKFFFSTEGPRSFSRGDNYDIVKIHWQNFKIFFSRTTGPISTKLGTKHLWVKRIQVCLKEGPTLWYNHMCVYWFELFSQVSDVAHGPLVFLISYKWQKSHERLKKFITTLKPLIFILEIWLRQASIFNNNGDGILKYRFRNEWNVMISSPFKHLMKVSTTVCLQIWP